VHNPINRPILPITGNNPAPAGGATALALLSGSLLLAWSLRRRDKAQG
jgi:hypothetical protein